MKSILVENQTIELTEHGFLKDPSQWSEQVAHQLADSVGIHLTPDHWKIIYFLRNFKQQFDVIPPLRILIRNLKAEFGDELGNSITLHKLFPESPVKYACLIAGLPKPKHCM